jgi:hypothetical protein
MTEQEWLALPDWRELFHLVEGRATDRQLRLFAAACCRGVWPLLDGESRHAVEVAERYADGLATPEELRVVQERFRATGTAEPVAVLHGRRYRPDHGASVVDGDALWAAKSAMRQSADLLAWDALRGTGRDFTATELGVALSAEMAARRRLLLEVVGPFPFGPLPTDPAWLTPTVLALARAAYDGRALPSGALEDDRLRVLADAVEEAGCVDAAVMAHLRRAGGHVRGCWAVDLLLGAGRPRPS